MKTSLFLAIVIVISLLPSCNAKVNGTVYSNSFVNNYYYTTGNELLFLPTDDINPRYKVRYGKPQILLQRWNQTEETRILLDSLCLRNHDVSYNRPMADFDYDNLGACADNFISMSVVSDADWDEKHKAGTSLDDIMTVEYESYREFIDSGYSRQSNFYGKKLLSDLQENDLWVVRDLSFYIEIQSLPTLSAKHTLTVTLTSDLGKVYTGTVVYEKK